MSDLSKKITELLSNECKAAPDMTHGLKNIGDGDMKEGMKIMVDFFEDLGRKISDVANDIGKKTEDTIEIQKLKSDMRTLRRANDRDLMDMGRMVYDKFVQGEISDLDYVAVCESIEKRDEEMKKIAEEIQHIKGVL